MKELKRLKGKFEEYISRWEGIEIKKDEKMEEI